MRVRLNTFERRILSTCIHARQQTLKTLNKKEQKLMVTTKAGNLAYVCIFVSSSLASCTRVHDTFASFTLAILEDPGSLFPSFPSADD